MKPFSEYRSAIKIPALSLLASIVWAPAAFSAQFYTSEEYDDFIAALPGPDYPHTFEAVDPGAMATPYVAEANGFGWSLSTVNLDFEEGDGLWALADGQVSTNTHSDSFLFTFAGSEVFAFGGDFYGTNLNGDPMTANVTFSTSTGQSHTVETTIADSFVGFISTEPLEWVRIAATTGVNTWPTTSGVITAIPEPATAGLLLGGLALGAGIWWRRRTAVRPPVVE